MDVQQISDQINQFLEGKNLTDQQRLGFVTTAVDLVRQKIAQEIQEKLTAEDFDRIEKMEGADEVLFEEMVKTWEQRMGKTREIRINEILLEFFEKFLELQKPTP